MTHQERVLRFASRLRSYHDLKDLEQVFKEVVQEEREQCAKICEDSVRPESVGNNVVYDLCTMSPYELARAIRSRMEGK